MNGQSERKEPRLKLALPIVGEWQTEDGLIIRINTLTDNISYLGVALLLDATVNWARAGLKIGSRIKLTANRHRYSATGTVCSASERPDGRWLIGLELDNPLFDWLARYRNCSSHLLANFLPTH